jgi:hypothetical protein
MNGFSSYDNGYWDDKLANYYKRYIHKTPILLTEAVST